MIVSIFLAFSNEVRLRISSPRVADTGEDDAARGERGDRGSRTVEVSFAHEDAAQPVGDGFRARRNA